MIMNVPPQRDNSGWAGQTQQMNNDRGGQGTYLGSSASRRPMVDDEGRPVQRVQRTQLLNLQPAGGKNNSSLDVFGPGFDAKEQIEQLENQLN